MTKTPRPFVITSGRSLRSRRRLLNPMTSGDWEKLLIIDRPILLIRIDYLCQSYRRERGAVNSRCPCAQARAARCDHFSGGTACGWRNIVKRRSESETDHGNIAVVCFAA